MGFGLNLAHAQQTTSNQNKEPGTKHFDFFMLGVPILSVSGSCGGWVFGDGVTLQRSQKHPPRASPGLRSSNNIIIIQLWSSRVLCQAILQSNPLVWFSVPIITSRNVAGNFSHSSTSSAAQLKRLLDCLQICSGQRQTSRLQVLVGSVVQREGWFGCLANKCTNATVNFHLGEAAQPRLTCLEAGARSFTVDARLRPKKAWKQKVRRLP